jgi:hypothetical protein
LPNPSKNLVGLVVGDVVDFGVKGSGYTFLGGDLVDDYIF